MLGECAKNNNLNGAKSCVKQTLILFIETGFADGDYNLIKHLDRSAFFPPQLSGNLSLFKHNFIEVSGGLSNGDPFKYAIKARRRVISKLTHRIMLIFIAYW